MKIKPSTVAFITGGASGLSQAFARRMVARGAKVAIADVNKKGMEEMQKEFGDKNCLTVECDVRDDEQIKHATNLTVEKFGGLHVGFTGAGIV